MHIYPLGMFQDKPFDALRASLDASGEVRSYKPDDRKSIPDLI